LNTQDLIKRIATGLGIDTEGLMKTEEELMAEEEAMMSQMQNQQIMGMAEKAVAPIASGIMKQQEEK